MCKDVTIHISLKSNSSASPGTWIKWFFTQQMQMAVPLLQLSVVVTLKLPRFKPSPWTPAKSKIGVNRASSLSSCHFSSVSFNQFSHQISTCSFHVLGIVFLQALIFDDILTLFLWEFISPFFPTGNAKNWKHSYCLSFMIISFYVVYCSEVWFIKSKHSCLEADDVKWLLKTARVRLSSTITVRHRPKL